MAYVKCSGGGSKELLIPLVRGYLYSVHLIVDTNGQNWKTMSIGDRSPTSSALHIRGANSLTDAMKKNVNDNGWETIYSIPAKTASGSTSISNYRYVGFYMSSGSGATGYVYDTLLS